MQRIPVEQVTFLSSASLGHSSRLFEWNGDLYRAFPSSESSLFRHLLSKGIIKRLVQKGLLIDTEPTSLSLEGYDLILKHRRVPFISYAFEWPAPMLKDAALLTIDLNIELARAGFATLDAHPWNILFDGSRPVFIDLGSIILADEDLPWGGVTVDSAVVFFILYI